MQPVGTADLLFTNPRKGCSKKSAPHDPSPPHAQRAMPSGRDSRVPICCPFRSLDKVDLHHDGRSVQQARAHVKAIPSGRS